MRKEFPWWNIPGFVDGAPLLEDIRSFDAT
jgi:hypothetical protein